MQGPQPRVSNLFRKRTFCHWPRCHAALATHLLPALRHFKCSTSHACILMHTLLELLCTQSAARQECRALREEVAQVYDMSVLRAKQRHPRRRLLPDVLQPMPEHSRGTRKDSGQARCSLSVILSCLVMLTLSPRQSRRRCAHLSCACKTFKGFLLWCDNLTAGSSLERIVGTNEGEEMSAELALQ